MKKILLIILTTFVMIGCRTYAPLKMQTEENPLDPKLPAMQLYTGDEYQNQMIGREEFNLFREEMETNIMTPYGDKYGSVFYSSRILKERDGFGWFYFSSLTLYTLNLIGFPLMAISRDIEVEVRIVDLQGRLIGKYKGRGDGSAVIALYYGYDNPSANRKVMHESVSEALMQIRSKVRKDAERLRNALLDSENE